MRKLRDAAFPQFPHSYVSSFICVLKTTISIEIIPKESSLLLKALKICEIRNNAKIFSQQLSNSNIYIYNIFWGGHVEY